MTACTRSNLESGTGLPGFRMIVGIGIAAIVLMACVIGAKLYRTHQSWELLRKVAQVTCDEVDDDCEISIRLHARDNLRLGSLLAAARHVEWETLSVSLYFPVSSSDISLLSKLPRLHILTIAGMAPGSPWDFSPLAELRELYVHDAPVDATDLADARLPQTVQALGLPRASNVGELAPRLPQIAYGVDWLNLSETDVSDEDLIDIARMPRLRQLLLDDTGITEDGLDNLRESHTLTHVTVNRMRLSEEAFHDRGRFSFKLNRVTPASR